MKCQKCNKNFEEKELELSHDIPKYIGGTDLDGRHWLCRKCHNIYELTILVRCLKSIGEEFYEETKIECMKAISKLQEPIKKEFRQIAQKVKEEFYG